jgi:hypothetical protein
MESPARLCRPGRQASLAHPRGKPGFSTFKSGCGRETDCLLEGDGFELLVPRYEGASRDMGLAQVLMSCKRRVAAIDLSGIALSPGLLETKTVCLSLA